MGDGITKLCMFCDKRLSDEDVRSLVVCIDCWRNPELIKKENANSGYPLLAEGWRDVRKQLPQESGDTIIYTRGHGVEIDEYVLGNGWYVQRIKHPADVIAWMPLTELGKPAFS